MKNIKGIFFDIGWTLNYPASGDWMLSNKFFEYVSAETLNSIPENKLGSVFNEAMEYLNNNHLVLNEQEELEQFKHYFKLISGGLPELGLNDSQIEEIISDKINNTDNYIFFDDVKPVLKQLSKNYKLGIISDTWPSARRILKSAEIYDYFDCFTLSCELGIYKPHPGMYKDALEGMNLPPEQTIFIDDSIENLKGAEKCGINPILINRSNYPEKIEQCSYKIIKALTELLDEDFT